MQRLRLSGKKRPSCQTRERTTLRDHPGQRDEGGRKGQSLRDLSDSIQNSQAYVIAAPEGEEREVMEQKKD